MESRERYGMSFTAGIGAESVRTLLEQIDFDATVRRTAWKND